MGVLGLVGGLFSLLGSGVSAVFGFKKAQGDAIQSALKIIGDVNSSEGQREAAIAQIISAEATSGYWLAAVWRPLTMIIFLGMIISFWFGYMPPNLNENMPPVVRELFNLMKIGLGGYIGGRTIEKVMTNMNIGKILKTYIEKKLL